MNRCPRYPGCPSEYMHPRHFRTRDGSYTVSTPVSFLLGETKWGLERSVDLLKVTQLVTSTTGIVLLFWSAVQLCKPNLFPIPMRNHNVALLPLCSNAKPMADINNQLHNSLLELLRLRILVNPDFLSSHHLSERACNRRLVCYFCGLPHNLLNHRNNCKGLVESRTKLDAVKARIVPQHQMSIMLLQFYSKKFGKSEICSSRIIIDD